MLTSLERLARTQVKGYIDFDPALRVGGLLFNKVGGEAHTRWMADAISSAGLGLRVLGGIPKVRGSGGEARVPCRRQGGFCAAWAMQRCS